MGREATCDLRVGARTARVKALLETTELIVRGELAARFPFAKMKRVRAKDGKLTFDCNGESVALTLGKEADSWASKITNPKSRADKLGIKPGQRVALIGVTDDKLREEVAAKGARIVPLGEEIDLVFFGTNDKADLKRLKELAKSIAQNGAIWLLRPKGRDDYKEADSMAAGKAAGLVDIKVVAFSETHSAEKYVIPVAKRR